MRSPARRPTGWLLAAALLLALSHPAAAERIGDLGDTDLGEQIVRFFQFRDRSVLIALGGCLLLGLNCGLLGGYVVVRKMALVGDALSHAVLPGIAIGFLWTMTRNPYAILAGATVAGFLGVLTVHLITSTTRLKRDTALGLVLSSYYALGVVLISMMKHLPAAGKAGLSGYYLGQAAAISADDLRLLAVVSALVILLVTLFYRPFLVLSFDRDYGESCGLPLGILHYLLMLLTTVAIVVSLQAVGVVLVSALLVIPASAAYLLADRMHRLLAWSAVIGMASAGMGVFASYLGNNLPTGPFIVVSAALLFLLAFLFAPRHGLVTRWARQRSRTRRTARENTLKAIYRVLEDRGFHRDGVSLPDLARLRRETVEEAGRRVRQLVRHGLATTTEGGNMVYLTPAGAQQAAVIVRNHRLWELYLTNVADYEADHVHDDAEKIEHILSEDTVRALEKQLQFPSTDPHGKRIPGMRETAPARNRSGQHHGYG